MPNPPRKAAGKPGAPTAGAPGGSDRADQNDDDKPAVSLADRSAARPGDGPEVDDSNRADDRYLTGGAPPVEVAKDQEQAAAAAEKDRQSAIRKAVADSAKQAKDQGDDERAGSANVDEVPSGSIHSATRAADEFAARPPAGTAGVDFGPAPLAVGVVPPSSTDDAYRADLAAASGRVSPAFGHQFGGIFTGNPGDAGGKKVADPMHLAEDSSTASTVSIKENVYVERPLPGTDRMTTQLLYTRGQVVPRAELAGMKVAASQEDKESQGTSEGK